MTPTATPKTSAHTAPGSNDDGQPGPVTAPSTPHTGADVVEALLAASRALVGLAARSLADLDAELGVNPSTGTRMCDRLVRKGLARRSRSSTDRRAVQLRLTPAGRALVEQVTQRRRDELTRIVAAMPATWHEPLTTALRTFATAAGEPPETEWWLGWTDTDQDG
jgi:DNA-binding MarR family transcriptional regulator